MKAAAYARYSTDKQQHNSIEYQLDEIQRYCAENNIEITTTYVDEGESGTNMLRPGFQSMMEAAARREFDAVVIYDISRGSRDVGDWFTFRRKMFSMGITVISATQKLGDLTDGNDFLLELLSVGMGQREVIETRRKSIAGVAVKAQQGLFLGGVAPLGYDIVKGKYVINEWEAQTVRKIFSMYANGESYNDILDAVADQRGKRGQHLGKNSLHSILTNERYIGVYTWNKTQVKIFRQYAGKKPNPKCVRIEGAIPAIINQDLWERVQKRMKDNKRNASNKAKHNYLLSGLIECEGCGAAFVGHTTTSGKGIKTRYYVCGNKYRTHTCTAKNINADVLETFIIASLKEYFAEIDIEAEAEKMELAGIEAKLQNGLRAILSGTTFVTELEDEMDRLRARKRELEEIIGRRTASKKKVDPADIVEVYKYAIEHWDEEPQRIIREHITRIYAHLDGTVSVNVGLHMTGCGGPLSVVCATILRQLAA